MNNIQSTMNSANSVINEMQNNVFFVPIGIVILAANVIEIRDDLVLILINMFYLQHQL